LSFELAGPGGAVGGSSPPTFIGLDGGSFPPGTIVSSAAFSGLVAGDYALAISGNIVGEVANYDVKVGVSAVPIPAAAILFGPALALFGLRRRRRQVS
jgi:hypothetical protein